MKFEDLAVLLLLPSLGTLLHVIGGPSIAGDSPSRHSNRDALKHVVLRDILVRQHNKCNFLLRLLVLLRLVMVDHRHSPASEDPADRKDKNPIRCLRRSGVDELHVVGEHESLDDLEEDLDEQVSDDAGAEEGVDSDKLLQDVVLSVPPVLAVKVHQPPDESLVVESDGSEDYPEHDDEDEHPHEEEEPLEEIIGKGRDR
mmetsp:Transcript_21308/g.70635  ORF Transcript_21308/g.70635 Transcript_21308/m.70635 type:complete len:200 (-) Transcript_21308:977-1576(-)